MRHVTLVCKNHPNLYWTCKSIAYTPGGGYNGQRHIFFGGVIDKTLKEHVDAPEFECKCPAADLVLAPTDPWASLSLEEQRKALAED